MPFRTRTPVAFLNTSQNDAPGLDIRDEGLHRHFIYLVFKIYPPAALAYGRQMSHVTPFHEVSSPIMLTTNLQLPSG
jgi:hypothetical protein